MYKGNILHCRDHFRGSDVRFEEAVGSFDYKDTLSEELDWMRRIQLLDTSAWARFVEVYRHQGIDSDNLGWRCEYWGKMMRGACFTYKCSSAPDDELYAVLEATVRDLLTTQDSLGRFATYDTQREFIGWDIWGRKYIMLGAIYFLDICRDEALADELIRAICRHADYIMEKIGPEEGKLTLAACTGAWDGMNSCSILEPFVMLYNITKEEKYLRYSEYIISFGGTLHQNLFELAYEDKTMIKDYSMTKAYEMISCFEGLAEYVKITKNEHYRRAVINFANRVLREENTVIGCLGCDYENFSHSVTDQFNDRNNDVMQETCVTVTWMKFMWQLWRMTGDVRYMDALELSAYNAMSASVRRHIDREANGGLILPIHSYNPLRHAVRSDIVGGTQYLEPVMHYGCRVYFSNADLAPEATASVGHGEVYINLFRNGIFEYDGMKVTMESGYPHAGDVKFTVEGERKPLYICTPAYAGAAKLITADGETICKDGCVAVDTAEHSEFTFYTPLEVRYGCCVCISTAGFALDTIASVGHDEAGEVYVNLYRRGTFEAQGMKVTMETDYPHTGVVKFTVEGEKKPLHIRIPAYAGEAKIITSDGETAHKSGYATVDTAKYAEFTLDIPMEIRFIHPTDVAETDVDYYISVARGPVCYATDDTLENEPVYPIDESAGAVYSDGRGMKPICRSAVTVKLTNGEELMLIDYRSAGQELGHKVSAWIRTK